MRSRLAAIVAADVAGYSRLIAQDDRATVAALDAARQVFRTHIEGSQGRVIDMAGDSVLAVFETAAGAVSVALAVQRDLSAASSAVPVDRRLHFRIGVHLGDVIEKADGTVYGDGVNIAARLQAMAQPGGINVSESVRAAVAGKVEAKFTELGAQRLKNITEPVRVHAVSLPLASGPAEKSVAGWKLRRVPLRSRLAASLALAGLALLGTLLAFTQGGSGLRSWLVAGTAQDHAREASARAAIAVLPFANLSGDPTRDYFSNGLTEDIINALGRFSGVMVISHNAVQPYKGKNASVNEISRELGVRYIVQGSVRQASERLRVTAELSDARTGSQLWSDRFDGQGKDMFDIQDRIVRSIVGTLAVKLTSLEQQRVKAKPIDSLEAYDLVLQARDLIHQPERGANRRARELLQRALAISADNADVMWRWRRRSTIGPPLDLSRMRRLRFSAPRSTREKHLTIDEQRAHAGAHATLPGPTWFKARTRGHWPPPTKRSRSIRANQLRTALAPGPCCISASSATAISNFEIAHGSTRAMPWSRRWRGHRVLHGGPFRRRDRDSGPHLARNPFMHVVRIAALAEAGRLKRRDNRRSSLREADPSFRWSRSPPAFRIRRMRNGFSGRCARPGYSPACPDASAFRRHQTGSLSSSDLSRRGVLRQTVSGSPDGPSRPDHHDSPGGNTHDSPCRAGAVAPLRRDGLLPRQPAG